jgi:hypothetical protein
MIKWRLDPGQIEVPDAAVTEVLRHKTPAERVAMIIASNRTARLMVEASVKRQHPDWDEAAVKKEVARRMLRGTG